MCRLSTCFLHEEGGATSIEYALIASVVAIMAIAGLVAFADANNGLYDQITAAVTSTGSGS